MTAVEDPRLLALLEGVSGTPPRAAHEWTAQSLRRALALGLFADRLPPERHLAETLGVSRITVRLALKALRDTNEVRSRPGRAGGSFPITRPATGADSSVIASARSDIADILAFRAAIEPTAASLAAVEGDPEILARLERSIETMAEEPTQQAFAASDSEFHLAIAEAAKSRRLRHALLVTRADLLLWRRRLPQLNYDPSYARANREEHLAIAQAIRAGDGRAAFDAMARHLDLAQTAFRRVLEA